MLCKLSINKIDVEIRCLADIDAAFMQELRWLLLVELRVESRHVNYGSVFPFGSRIGLRESCVTFHMLRRYIYCEDIFVASLTFGSFVCFFFLLDSNLELIYC